MRAWSPAGRCAGPRLGRAEMRSDADEQDVLPARGHGRDERSRSCVRCGRLPQTLAGGYADRVEGVHELASDVAGVRVARKAELRPDVTGRWPILHERLLDV